MYHRYASLAASDTQQLLLHYAAIVNFSWVTVIGYLSVMPINFTKANSFFIYSSFLYIGVAAPRPSFTPLSILVRIHCKYEVCPYYKDTLLTSLFNSSLSEPRSERYIITKSLTNHAVGSRICIRAVNKNTKIPHAKTVPSTIDNIAPLRFVDDEVVDQAWVEVGVGVD